MKCSFLSLRNSLTLDAHMERSRCQIRNYLLCFEFNCFSHTRALLLNNFPNFDTTEQNFSSLPSFPLSDVRGKWDSIPSSLIHLNVFNWKSFINVGDQNFFCFILVKLKLFESATLTSQSGFSLVFRGHKHQLT